MNRIAYTEATEHAKKTYEKETAQDAYLAGFSRGWNCASWQDIPEIGSTLPLHIDWQGIGEIKNASDQGDALQILASEGESNDRCFSPFEFTAHDFNSADDEPESECSSEELWEAFDAGINDGICANINDRLGSAIAAE